MPRMPSWSSRWVIRKQWRVAGRTCMVLIIQQWETAVRRHVVACFTIQLPWPVFLSVMALGSYGRKRWMAYFDIVNKARQVSGYYWAKPRNGHVGWAVNHLFVHEESGPGGGQHTSTGSAVEDDVEWPRRLANRRFGRRRAVARGRLRPDSYLCFPFPLPLQNCIQKPLATSRTCDVHRCLVFSDSLSGLLTSGVQADPKSMQLEGYLRI